LTLVTIFRIDTDFDESSDYADSDYVGAKYNCRHPAVIRLHQETRMKANLTPIRRCAGALCLAVSMLGVVDSADAQNRAPARNSQRREVQPVEYRSEVPAAPSSEWGYRAAPVRVASNHRAGPSNGAPSWQRRPDVRTAAVNRRLPGEQAAVYPFEEDQAENIGPAPRVQAHSPQIQEYDGEPVPDSWEGGEYQDGDWGEEGFCGDFCGPGGCPDWGCRDPMECERFAACSPLSFLNESYLAFGTHGFKTPLDFGRVGNFGFDQTINISDSIWHTMGIGYQFGARFAESNFSGDQATGAVRQSSRFQTFITAGFFHRAFYGCGWQYGVVVDYLAERYYVTADNFQVRTEISRVWRNGHEFGFTGHLGSQDDPLVLFGVNRTVRTIDQYRLFYRINFENGANGRFWAGATNTNCALAGADFRMPIHNRFDIVGNWNYLMPTGTAGGGTVEAWNMGMALVWYPGRRATGVHNGPYRALFDVADNGVFPTRLTTP